MVSSRPWSLRWPRRGMQRSRPTVYGWRGLSNTSRAVPSSTIAPAYSTPTRSHIFAITPRLWRDEQHRGVGLVAQRGDEVEHLRLDGRVERGRRLVEDQQLRVDRERHRDHDALRHAARELVRVAAQHRAGVGDLDAAQRRLGPFARPRSSTRRRSRTPRTAGGRRAATGSAHASDPGRPSTRCAARSCRSSLSDRPTRSLPSTVIEPAGDAAVLGQVAHRGHRGRRLAAARLADQAERLAGPDRERDAAQHLAARCRARGRRPRGRERR